MDGQLNAAERELVAAKVKELKPAAALEVGTWLGGGSTLHILQALEANGAGHLWGIEAYEDIYERMIVNIRGAGEDIARRFTPLFGFSHEVIPRFLAQHPGQELQLVFLDGGDNPNEQVLEFHYLADSMPVGGVLLSHDAKLRKGKWLVPYLGAHDNWTCQLHDVSEEGLFEATKMAPEPSEKSRKHARRVLRRLRLDPIEVVGRLLPSGVIDATVKCLPKRLVHRITQGRRPA